MIRVWHKDLVEPLFSLHVMSQGNPYLFICYHALLRSSAYKAIHAAIVITKSFAEEEDSLPLNVAMEMRFTKHSDCPLSPAYGKEVRVQ